VASLPELKFTSHALIAVAERKIDRAWVEAALSAPDWTVSDRKPGRMRAFRAVPERGGRILRVVYDDIDGVFHVVTAFLDRNAKKP